MRAHQISAPGGPEALKLVELPDPEPRDGWVKIRVHAFGLNRSEMYTRQGHSGDDVPFPRVLGIECVGEVLDAGGTDLVTGQTVCAAMGGLGRRYDGGYAEMTLVPRSQVMCVETSLPWDVLGALPETWFTSWLSVFDVLQAEPGQRFLIRGGTSAAGMAATSILKHLGVHVIATTRSEKKRAALVAAGVDDVVIDSGAIAGQVRALAPGGVDAALELVGSVAAVKDSVEAIRDGGRICHTGILANEWGKTMPEMPRGITYEFGDSGTVNSERWTPIWRKIVEGVEAGYYQPNIFKVFAFEDVVEAHRMMEESRAAGKLVVMTRDAPDKAAAA